MGLVLFRGRALIGAHDAADERMAHDVAIGEARDVDALDAIDHGATVRAETIDGPVDVKIPKGANTGTTMRLRGKGVADQKSGTRGDHLIELRVALPEAADADLARLVAEWEEQHPYNPRIKGGHS